MEEKKEEEITSNTTGEEIDSSNTEKVVESKEETTTETKEVTEEKKEKEKEEVAVEEKTVEKTELSEKPKEEKVVSVKAFLLAVLVIALVVLGFVYSLEKKGKITSNVFTDVIPVAKVDGKVISVREYENNYRQLELQAKAQGYSVDDPEVVEQIKNQVMDNLVNFELLRKEAKKAGKEASKEETDARLKEITDSIGGEESLNSRLLELGIDRTELLKEVEDDIVIQKLFEEEIFPSKDTKASEDEITDFYNQLGGGEGVELPPLEEIKAQISGQIETEKQQKIIGDYLEELKNNSTIEILKTDYKKVETDTVETE